MITQWLVEIVGNVVTWILGLLPTLTVPEYLSGTGGGTANGTVTDAVSGLWSFDAFLPVTQLVAACALVLASLLVAVTVRVVRIVASFLTAGGGAAG